MSAFQGPTPLRSRARPAAWVVTTVTLLGCAAGPGPSTPPTGPTGTATSGPAATASPASTGLALALQGRIYFGRFDLDIMGMTVWVMNADGSDQRLFVPGSRLLSCVLPGTGQVVMTGSSPDGRIVPSVANADGSGFRELDVPDATLNLGVAACSPDGRHLAAEGWDETRPKRTGIYTLDLDGTELNRLTTAGLGAHDIPGCYLPDGSAVAFLRYVGDAHDGSLHLVPNDGSGARRVGTESFGTGPACMPDGGELLLVANDKLIVVDAADGTSSEIRSAAPGFEAASKYGPWLSPDGSMVAFAMQLPGPYHDIYAIRLDGSGLTRLTFHPQADNESPRWVLDP